MKNKAIGILKFFIYCALIGINVYAAVLFFFICKSVFLHRGVSKSSNVRAPMFVVAKGILYSVPAYLAIVLFFYGSWQHSIHVNKIQVLASVEMLVLMIIPIIFYFAKHKKTKVILKKNDYLLIIGVFIPFLISDIFLFAERYYRFFEITDIISEILNKLIFAALFEELFFRFFLYQKLKQISKNVLLSQLLSSLLFSLWHINLVQNLFCGHQPIEAIISLITIFFVGVICSVLYEKTERLSIVILFHAVNNGLFYNLMNVAKNYIVDR